MEKKQIGFIRKDKWVLGELTGDKIMQKQTPPGFLSQSPAPQGPALSAG